MKDKQLWFIVALATFLLILGTSLASAQEVGDTLTLVVIETPEAVAPETVTVQLPVPVEVCPEGWTCTPPIVVVDTIPPLAVSGLTMVLDGNVVTTNWTNRPNPDRGGVGTDGYEIHSGNDATGQEYLPRDTLASGPHIRTLTESGRIWTCVYAFNAAGRSGASCNNVVYELFEVGIPNDSSDYAMGVGCDWGDQRCTDGGELVNVALETGRTGRLIGLIEFPPDDRIFVSFQEEIVQVVQNDRGWVCVLSGGDSYPFPTIAWEFPSSDPTVASVDSGPMLALPVACP